MKQNLLSIAILLTSFWSNAQCISGDCENGEGIYVYQNNSRYEGQFRSGQRNGNGKLFLENGDVYDGEFDSGDYAGEGKYIFKTGGSHEGIFAEGQFITGTHTMLDGTEQIGNFRNGRIYGQGTQKGADGEFQGNFKEGVFDGQGSYTFPDGDRFVGEFREGKQNGKGVLYFQKGGTLKGTWIDGEYVSGSSGTSQNEIQLIQESGVLAVKVTINGVPVDMIFDTGAAMLNLTPDILLPAFRNGTITEEDIIGGGEFVDANGDVNTNLILNIKEVVVGNFTLKDVKAAVANTMDGMNLFGLSGIKKLGNVRIDFDEQTIIPY